MFFKRNKKLHRNGSIRLSHYNYGQNGYYFVTICTKYRDNIFGKIIDGQMKYNDLGNVVIEQWREIKKHYPFVELDEFIVMPDHVHGIIIINKQNVDIGFVGACEGIKNGFVGACRGMRQQEPNKFGKPQNGSLSVIINHFKGSITKHANINNIPFKWQPLYYEHIIRDKRALNNIRQYIRNNPRIWHN